jgi:hypothetical protein
MEKPKICLLATTLYQHIVPTETLDFKCSTSLPYQGTGGEDVVYIYVIEKIDYLPAMVI